MSRAPRYVLISPCRDEARHMRRTLESVSRQSRPPDLWVVVDDGSSDATPAILAEYRSRLPYLRVLRREDRGRRSVGPGVIEAFDAGLATLDLADFDYLCKLDLDLELPAGYFEGLLARMQAEPALGTCSGKPWYRDAHGRRVFETCGDEMSVGMTKFYRTTCFRAIGGFVPEVMWDGIDCHRCRMLGWRAASFADEALAFEHLRPMGSSQGSLWAGRLRHGRGQWFMGTGFLFLSASALYRTTRPPFLEGGLALWLGYVTSLLRARPRYADAEFRAYLRRYQRASLVLGKRRAIARLEQQRVRAGTVATP